MSKPQLPLTRFFHPICPSKDLRSKPLAAKIGEEKIVLFRDADGRPAAVEDKCPHRFTPLSAGAVKNGQIACPYHGWTVSKDGSVKAPHIGTLKGCEVKAYQVIEKYNYLWVADRNVDLNTFPLNQSTDWKWLASYFMDFDAPLHVVLDNFSEDEHFPYVHNVLGWNEELAKDVKFNYRVNKDQIEVHYLGPQRPFPLMRLFMMKPSHYFRNDWVARFDPPRTTYTVQMTDKNGLLDNIAINEATIFFVPTSAGTTRVHVFQFAKGRKPSLNFLIGFFKPTLVRWARNDLWNDGHFVKKLKDVPYSFKGMRLSKYDGPLVQGRHLLERIYYGTSSADETLKTQTDSSPTL